MNMYTLLTLCRAKEAFAFANEDGHMAAAALIRRRTMGVEGGLSRSRMGTTTRMWASRRQSDVQSA